METKFYKCPHCGNVIVKVVDSGIVPVCCGETMQLLDPKVMDGAKEKHVPVLARLENGALIAKVGEVAHPMLPEHHICIIVAECAKGIDVHYLDPTQPAEAILCDSKGAIVAVYEYCNLHGLWKTTEIPSK